jgi:hypothetical protein
VNTFVAFVTVCAWVGIVILPVRIISLVSALKTNFQLRMLHENGVNIVGSVLKWPTLLFVLSLIWLLVA